MKVVHLCTYDRGGAAQAALRIQRELLAAGVESQCVVAAKTIDDPNVVAVPGAWHRWTWPLVPRLEYRLARFFAPRGPKPWGPLLLPGCAFRYVESLQPDVVHLHWVANGFLSIEQLPRFRAPLVWTLHDMGPLTPGYGYRLAASPGLRGFEPHLPLMPGPPFHRLARHVWWRKMRAWRNLRATLVAPSQWLAEEARRSAVFAGREIRTIPYAAPLATFCPLDRPAARRELGLPEDRALVLFGADASGGFRKGADLLAGALAQIAASARPLAVLFGASGPEEFRRAGVEALALGMIHDERRLAKLYAACDVFACPSREDNLPNTALESFCAGTPVVGFRVGGLPDMVESGANGFLAEPFDTAALGAGLADLLAAQRATGAPGRAARQTAEQRFAGRQVAEEYLALYRRITAASR